MKVDYFRMPDYRGVGARRSTLTALEPSLRQGTGRSGIIGVWTNCFGPGRVDLADWELSHSQWFLKPFYDSVAIPSRIIRASFGLVCDWLDHLDHFGRTLRKTRAPWFEDRVVIGDRDLHTALERRHCTGAAGDDAK